MVGRLYKITLEVVAVHAVENKGNIVGGVACDKEALAGQMAVLLGDPQKAEAMGAAAKKIMETNAPKQIFDQWEAYLRSLI